MSSNVVGVYALPAVDDLPDQLAIEAALLQVEGVRLVQVDIRSRTVKVGRDFVELAVRTALSVLVRAYSGSVVNVLPAPSFE